VEVSQKLPFIGKRSLRGQMALAQTAAVSGDLEDTKLQLREAARIAFADYYYAERALEVNEQAQQLLQEFKNNAEARYRTGQAPQQDVLQAEVEIAQLTQQRLTLQRDRTIAQARLNTLMNNPADAALPPPSKRLTELEPLPDIHTLRTTAQSRRPDLLALRARLAADQAALALAQREYYPDIEAMAAYDSFWQAADMQQRLRPQLGLRFNLPVRWSRRQGAVVEMAAALAQRQAQLTQLINQINLEVEQARALLQESQQSLRLYQHKILPAARDNIKAAQSAYMTGKIPFLSLIETQRRLIALLEGYYQAQADYLKRQAMLERTIGASIDTIFSKPTKSSP
jgi:outer membrane protein TolC